MTNAQRINNICYPRGSVVYAKFDKKSEYYYLNMRPLIVVSNQTQMFNSLTVISCGSRDRPGVEISLFNHRKGRWVGNHQFSVAQPYAVFSILVPQIVEFLGVIDPWTLDAIDRAMAFHLGLSKEVPPYMENIYDDLLKPVYSMGTDENTQLNDPHQFGSYNEVYRSFPKLPSHEMYDSGKPYQKINSNTANSTHQTYTNSQPMIDDKHETGNTNVYVDNSILDMAASLTEIDCIGILTKRLKPGKYGETKSITILPNQISQIRNGVEILYNLHDGKFIKMLSGKICHQQKNFRFLSKFEKVAAVLYGTPETLAISDAIYKNIAIQVIKEYKLQFDDGRSWRNFKNFDRLKDIYMSIN